jgi:hypothetical protein
MQAHQKERFCADSHQHLDGVGEGQANRSGAQLDALHHRKHGHCQHQDGAIKVTVERQPQVE